MNNSDAIQRHVNNILATYGDEGLDRLHVAVTNKIAELEQYKRATANVVERTKVSQPSKKTSKTK